MTNTKIITHSKKPTKENLKRVYDVFNKVFQNQNVFYSSEEVKKLKLDKNNTFL